MTRQAQFRFHAELNDLLPRSRREASISLAFNPGQSLKHLVESLGVPHTEIQNARVNGVPVELSYQVQDGDRVEVFPAGPIRLDGERRFILDNHLGRLAAYLRMLGFDCLYRNDYQDDELAAASSVQGRILLTRDKHLLMRTQGQFGYWVRSKVPRRQLEEVVRRFDLAPAVRPFQRCVRCNGLLQPVSKAEILHRLEPLTCQYYDEFRRCPDCGQIYWKGSHFARMQRLVEQVIADQSGS